MRKVAFTVIWKVLHLCFLIYSSQNVLDKHFYFLQIWKQRLRIKILTFVSHFLKKRIANIDSCLCKLAWLS